MSDHFNEVVDSYMVAARVLMLSRAYVEMAVMKAKRIEQRCCSCRFSRAPHDVVERAIQRNVLDIFRRRCIRQPPMSRCKNWQELEVPQEVIETV